MELLWETPERTHPEWEPPLCVLLSAPASSTETRAQGPGWKVTAKKGTVMTFFLHFHSKGPSFPVLGGGCNTDTGHSALSCRLRPDPQPSAPVCFQLPCHWPPTGPRGFESGAHSELPLTSGKKSTEASPKRASDCSLLLFSTLSALSTWGWAETSRAQSSCVREICWAGRVLPTVGSALPAPCCRARSAYSAHCFLSLSPTLRLSSPPHLTHLPVLCLLRVSLPATCLSATRLPSLFPSLLQQAWDRRVSELGAPYRL